jgi:uncharacterized protein YkwD
MGRLMKRVLVSMLLFALVACGGRQKSGLSGSASTQIRFEGDLAAAYESRAEGDAARGLHAGTIQDAVFLASKSHGLTIEGDPRLSALAELLAPHLREGGKLPPPEVVQFFARHLGVTFPEIHSLLVGTPNVSAIGASVSDGVASYLARVPYDRYGAYTFEREGLTISIVLLASSHVSLEAVPREVDVNAELHLRGSLRGGLTRPELVVIHSDGRSERSPAGRGSTIDHRVRLETKGLVRLQLLAQGDKGTVPVATMPVAVGVGQELVLTLGGRDAAAGASDPEEIKRALLQLVASARAEAGLAPLMLDEGLSQLALAHSLDMKESSFIGHTSPTHGTPAERAARGGYRSGLILENVGRGASARDVHDGLVASPAHHRNLLNPDVTHVGIGVEPDGKGEFLVTQIFLKMNADVDVEEARRKLLDAINQARRARGAKPVSSDTNLEAAATEGAREYFADPSIDQHEAVAKANAAVRKFSIVFARIGSVMTVVDDVEQAYRLEPTFDPGIRYVGIGVAQGDRPDAPPNSIAVIVLLGWPR